MSKQTAKVEAECLLLNDPLHTLIQGKPFNNSSGQNLKSIKKQTLCKNQKAFPVFDLNFLSLHCPNGNGEMKILLIGMQNPKPLVMDYLKLYCLKIFTLQTVTRYRQILKSTLCFCICLFAPFVTCSRDSDQFFTIASPWHRSIWLFHTRNGIHVSDLKYILHTYIYIYPIWFPLVLTETNS